MIPGVSAFWSHEKHGPKPPLQVSSLVPSANISGETSTPIKDPSKVTSLTGHREEWPVLPTSNNKKRYIELPEAGSPPPLAPPGLPDIPAVRLDKLPEKANTAQPTTNNTSVLGIVADGLNDQEDVVSVSRVDVKQDRVSKRADEAEGPSTPNAQFASRNVAAIGKSVEEQHKSNAQPPGVDAQIEEKPACNNISRPIEEEIALVTPTAPLIPNVRLSPAPSADERMTILVEGLSKDETEEAIKKRFRAYGRIVSPVVTIAHFHELINGC